MQPPFTRNMKRHATGPALRIQIKNKSDRLPFDLTGASVKFLMYEVEDDSTLTELVNAAATLEDAEEGLVKYEWQAGDTAEIGSHLAEFEITLSGGEKEVYPSKGYIAINIERDLDNA